MLYIDNPVSDLKLDITCNHLYAKQKYRGMFETQKSGNKTRSGEIGLNIRTLASSDVAIIPDNRLSIAERLRLRWSIILFINRLSPMSPKAKTQNAA